MPSFPTLDTEYLPISPGNTRKLLKLITSVTDVSCLSLNTTAGVLGGRWGRRIKQDCNSSQESKLEVTGKTSSPDIPKSYSGDEMHSSQITTLILTYHPATLTINETLKEKTKQKKKTPKPEKKKFKCHSIHKPQTILFKLLLCALLKLSFQHITFHFHQMLHVDKLRYSYTMSIDSLNFIMLITLTYHSSKSGFFNWNCEISVFVQCQNRLCFTIHSLKGTLSILKKWKFNCSLLFKIKM